MQYSLLGWTFPSFCYSRGQTLESRPVRLFAVLMISSHLMAVVSGADLTRVGRHSPEDPPNVSNSHQGGRGRHQSPASGRVETMDQPLLSSEYSSFDGDGLPGTQEEFKIEVPPAKEECFFQFMKTGTRLHSTFQVLRGADLNIDFTLTSPDGFIIQIEPWTSRGSISNTIDKEGVYALCLGNNMSKYSRKLVHIYFQTQLATDWHNYTSAIVEYQTELLNMTRSLQTVQSRIPTMKVTLAMLRMNFAKDENNVSRMKETVQKRSVVLCIVIIVVAVFQVFFVRRLFKTSIVTPSAKIRA